MGRRSHPELYRAPFPLYTIQIDPESGLVLTAGGGGAARTGVKNGVHFLRLEQINGKLSASLLHSHDTETRAPINMSLADNVLAVGQDASCHLLKFKIQKPEEKKVPNGPEKAGGKEKGPRKRKPSSSAVKDGGGDTKNETTQVTVEDLQVVQTDFSPDSLQKSVCFSPDRSMIVTGGVDGFVLVWEYPSMKKMLDFKAHNGEIEDLAVDPGNKRAAFGVLSALGPKSCKLHWVAPTSSHRSSHDFQCCVWKKDQLVTALQWNENLPAVPDKAYRYQACRFGKVEDDKDVLRLYNVQIPYKRERKPPPCYITKWDGKSFLLLLTQPCGN